MGVLRWLGGLFRSLAELILPFVGQARASRGLWRAVRVVVHVLVVAAVLVALYWLNKQPWLRTEVVGRFGDFWLPILFLLLYTLGWLSWWLYKLWTTEEQEADYPDIDRAWAEALAALRQAPLSLTNLPLFLILGRPEEDERALFQAAQLTLKVQGAPARPDAPLHLYATDDAIYLTCAGASLLGAYAASLAPKGAGAAEPAPAGGQPEEDPDAFVKTLAPGATITPGALLGDKEPLGDMAELLRRAQREGRPLSKVEKRVLRSLYRKDNPNRGLLRDAPRVEEHTARLRHLCRLVARDRHPYCAVNGVLVLIPFAGTDSDDDAVQTASACLRDVEATAALKVHCPTYALVCDMETAPGFVEFVRCFKPQERLQRWGRSCPLAPDLPSGGKAGAASRVVETLAGWICRAATQAFVYRKFQTEKTGEDLTPAVETNSRLFLLFDALHERGDRLGRILAALVAPKGSSAPPLFGGCYLAGTGTDAADEQAFVKGLLADKLLETEELVYWTAQARAEDAAYSRWVSLGWTALALVVVAVVGAALASYYS